MPDRKYGRPHQRARAALLNQIQWGLTPCSRCGHPLAPGDRVDLDHTDDGTDYLGFAHSSACRICRRRCNQAAGGELAALLAGKQLRDRRCVICGKPYTAGTGSSGARQATCGAQPCVTRLRRIRRARAADPAPPPSTGRVW